MLSLKFPQLGLITQINLHWRNKLSNSKPDIQPFSYCIFWKKLKSFKKIFVQNLKKALLLNINGFFNSNKSWIYYALIRFWCQVEFAVFEKKKCKLYSWMDNYLPQYQNMGGKVIPLLSPHSYFWNRGRII